jgi:hypothetical protein
VKYPLLHLSFYYYLIICVAEVMCGIMDIYCFCVHMYVCLSTQLVCVTNLLELNLGESTTLLIWLFFFYYIFVYSRHIQILCQALCWPQLFRLGGRLIFHTHPSLWRNHCPQNTAMQLLLLVVQAFPCQRYPAAIAFLNLKFTMFFSRCICWCI